MNTFRITNSELAPLGTGLYLGASIFDHSCEPMAVATFESMNIYIRNIADIPASFPVRMSQVDNEPRKCRPLKLFSDRKSYNQLPRYNSTNRSSYSRTQKYLLFYLPMRKMLFKKI